jgi:hypothetical protein
MAAQQLDAEGIFELPDLQAERRLRNVQLLGRTRDVAEFDDAREVTELAQCDGVLLRPARAGRAGGTTSYRPTGAITSASRAPR